MKAAIKFIIGVSLLPVFFIYAGCRTEQENAVIDGKPQKVCGWEKHYVIKNPEHCKIAKFGCEQGMRIFSDSRGCGCEQPVLCGDRE